jgi:uncharacterized membrane protein YcaP (DUF421 family)
MEDFKVFDFHRIFIGDLPISFLLEIVFRTVIMYCYTIFLLRILGKRGMGQLSSLELAIIISFGSAVGDPMIGADAPILHGIVAITAVAILQVYLERYINKNKKVEAYLEGQPKLVVLDGLIQWDCMIKENLSKEDLFRSLRLKDVEHLGQVHKALFEISGQVSVMFQHPKNITAGLSILPEDYVSQATTYNNGDAVESERHYSCVDCGHTKFFKSQDVFTLCDKCGKEVWSKAVL